MHEINIFLMFFHLSSGSQNQQFVLQGWPSKILCAYTNKKLYFIH